MMRMMKIWLVMMVVFGVDTSVEGKDHNLEAYNALCTLLGSAVRKWGGNGESLSEPMKRALAKTLFGNDDGMGSLETLKGGLPGDYKGVEKYSGSRALWCGQPRLDKETQGRWPGHSAPHDMVCLCTAGEMGWPVNISNANEKLCGQDKNALRASGNKGWDSQNQGGKQEGNAQVEATWNVTVTPCLSGRGKGEDLEKALDTLIENFNHTHVNGHGDIDRLGEGKFVSFEGCTGSSTRGVCVIYYNSLPPTPWWKILKEALMEDKQLQKKSEEEEKRKQKEGEEQQESPQVAALTYGHPITNQTEQNNHDSNNTAKIEKLRSNTGTPITPPSSWLLSAALLI